MAAKIGFKRLTIRILDDQEPTLDTNLFVLEGKTDKGATRSAKISGLSAKPVKSYGSNVAYYTARKGVGDVKVDLELLDTPEKIVDKILGYIVKNGITLTGADTEAPYCSILMESDTKDNKVAALGFFKGSFSMDGDEIKTFGDSKEELPSETYEYTALASDDEEYKGMYQGKIIGGTEEELKKLKQALGMDLPGA